MNLICFRLHHSVLAYQHSIIALHGLATDGEITWKHDNKKIGIPVNWLRDKHMLPDRIPNSRIMTYDWNATVRKDVSDMTLANEAVRLIKTIQLDRREKVASPHIFTSLIFRF